MADPGAGPEKPAREDSGQPDPPAQTSRKPNAIYSVIIGLVFVALIAVAGVNAIRSEGGGVLGAADEGDRPLAQFAVPDARGELEGDANVAQDDCETASIPCGPDDARTAACKLDLEGAIRVCDYFDRPLALSFWFTKGGNCEEQQDVFEAAYRRYRGKVGFLAIDVRDDRGTVQGLIRSRGWTHPIGLDPDGALSHLYRVGGCPTIVYAYPGGILRDVSIGMLQTGELDDRIEALIAGSRERARGRPS